MGWVALPVCRLLTFEFVSFMSKRTIMYELQSFSLMKTFSSFSHQLVFPIQVWTLRTSRCCTGQQSSGSAISKMCTKDLPSFI